MAAETQYTANTGMVQISTANSNLDGTGTLGTIITAASNGTLVKTITVKATGNTTPGMVRIFSSGANTRLMLEIPVPAVTRSSRIPSFETTVEVNYQLPSGASLKASTQNAETFNVFAEGLNWTYYTTSVRPESTKYTANNGAATVSVANSNLDGTGTLGTVLTAAQNGTTIQSVVIKAQVSTTPGMVRLFLYDGSNTRLFSEIPVNYVTKSGIAHSFSRRIDFFGRDFKLKTNWVLKASTENAESFNVIAESLNWNYPA